MLPVDLLFKKCVVASFPFKFWTTARVVDGEWMIREDADELILPFRCFTHLYGAREEDRDWKFLGVDVFMRSDYVDCFRRSD